MKIRVNEYILENEKINEDKRVACITDVHSNVSALFSIVEVLKQIPLDYIFLVGDTVDCQDEEKKLGLILALNRLNSLAQVYLSMGNHEIYEKDIYLYGKSKKQITEEYFNFFSMLEKLTPCISLLNEFETTQIDDSIILNALNVPFYCYKNETEQNFLKVLSSLNYNIDEKKFNILLSHSPNCIINSDKIKYFLETDLILSGHNHGGLVPTFIQDKLNNHVGLMGPYGKIMQNSAYGFYENDDASLIVSNGVTRISKNINKLVFKPEVEIIKLQKGEQHSLKLVKRNIYKA